MDRITNIYIPRWAAVIYSALAIVLLPWIFNLAVSLPSRHVAWHWDAVWVGFDALMFLAMAITVFFMLKRKIWVVVSATALATLFIIDAWFDTLTAKPGREQRIAILFGVLETVLAGMTYRMVLHIVHYSTPEKNFQLGTKRSQE